MKKKILLHAALFAAVSVLASCNSMGAKPPVPPVDVGSDEPPIDRSGWTPYGSVPTHVPLSEKHVPVWKSAATEPGDISRGELAPPVRVSPVDPEGKDSLQKRIEAVKAGNPAMVPLTPPAPRSSDSAWGNYKSTASGPKSYSSKPQASTGLPVVRVDPVWAAENIPVSARSQFSAMITQASRSGSITWTGLNGRKVEANAVDNKGESDCTQIDIRIYQQDTSPSTPDGHAEVCDN